MHGPGRTRLGKRNRPGDGVLGAVRLVALAGLRQKRGARWHGSTGQRLPDRTVTGHNRDIVDVSLRVAEEAEAVDQLISERGAPRTEERRCCGLWQGRDPVGERLRNGPSRLICRPDLTRSRRLARTLHVAPGQVRNRRPEQDRTGTVRLRKRRSAAGCGSDRDLPPGRSAGRSGAKREIPAANLEVVNLSGRAASRRRRRKCEEHRTQN